MIQEYSRTFSEKMAIESTSKKFNVKKEMLYVDWGRRNRWLPNIISLKDSSNLIRLLLIEIDATLKQVDKMILETDNDNCRLGALKLKVNSVFKLIGLYRCFDEEDLRERVENLEKIEAHEIEQQQKLTPSLR